VPARHNSVVAATHVFDGGGLAVTIGRLGTGGTGVVFVESETMSPAVKDLGAVIGSDHAGGGNGSWLSMHCCSCGGVCGSSIGTAELSFAGGEAPKAFFVCCCKGGLELSNCAVGSSKGKPVVTCKGKQASGFEEKMRLMAMASEIGSLPAIAMQHTSWRCSHNNLMQSGFTMRRYWPNSFQDQTMLMCHRWCSGDQVDHSDSGKPEDGVFEGSKVESVNCQDELLFQFFYNSGTRHNKKSFYPW